VGPSGLVDERVDQAGPRIADRVAGPTHPGPPDVQPRQRDLHEVLGPGGVTIKRLRAKIESDPSNPRCILTVRGLGYKFDATEE
jgi:hypothetical protein